MLFLKYMSTTRKSQYFKIFLSIIVFIVADSTFAFSGSCPEEHLKARLAYNSGVFWAGRGDYQKSFDLFSEALEICPDYADAITEQNEVGAILDDRREKKRIEEERILEWRKKTEKEALERQRYEQHLREERDRAFREAREREALEQRQYQEQIQRESTANSNAYDQSNNDQGPWMAYAPSGQDNSSRDIFEELGVAPPDASSGQNSTYKENVFSIILLLLVAFVFYFIFRKKTVKNNEELETNQGEDDSQKTLLIDSVVKPSMSQIITDWLQIILGILFVLALIVGTFFPGLDAEAFGFILFVVVWGFLWTKWFHISFPLSFLLVGIYMLSQGGDIGIIMGLICIAIGVLFLSVLLGKEPPFLRKLESETSVANTQFLNRKVSKSINQSENQQILNRDVPESITPSLLINLRNNLGRTQEEMAKILQVSYLTWRKWETGIEIPNPVYQGKIRNLIEWVDKCERQE